MMGREGLQDENLGAFWKNRGLILQRPLWPEHIDRACYPGGHFWKYYPGALS